MFAFHGSFARVRPLDARFGHSNSVFSVVFRLAELLAVIFLVAAPAAGQCNYTQTVMPNPPGWYAVWGKINNLGQVCGRLANLGDYGRGFKWTPETGFQILPMPAGYIDMYASDMNDSGVITGWMNSGTTNRGYVWDGQQFTYFYAPDGGLVEPAAINNAGVVTGTLRLGSNIRPFIWRDGVLYDLAGFFSPFGYGESLGISELGTFCGYVVPSPIVLYGFTSDSATIQLLPQPPNVNWTRLYAANSNGYGAGYTSIGLSSDPSFRWVAMYWSPLGPTVLYPQAGSRDALLFAMNALGHAVGAYARTANDGILVRFGRVDRLRDLAPQFSPGSLSTAFDINGRGQLLMGSGSSLNLLTPQVVPGDITGDCRVDLDDLTYLLINFGNNPGVPSLGDVNSDGSVDLIDLATLLTHYGE